MRPRILLPALWLLTASGCDSILETDPVDQLPSDDIIVDGPTARAALTGVYDALQDLSYYGRNFLILADLSADNAEHVGTLQALGELDRHQVRADNTTVEGVWQAIYEGIGRINLILAEVPDVPFLDETERDQILGEAHFLRALHYHDLVKLWGGVPLVLEPIRTASEATGFTRASEEQVYQQILGDLDSAEQLMTDEDQTRQASLGAARALRSRVLLYMEDWAGAEAAAEEVLAMSYSLAAAYEDLFSVEGANTPEDIFRIDFNAVEYNELGYYYLFDGRYETAPTADLFEAYATGDTRHPWSVAEDGGEYEGTKFPTTAGTEDLHVIRLGEVILNYAEALARQGELEAAVDAYNEIRVRAGLAPHTLATDVTTQVDVIDTILHERRLELALEGDRWPDLVRTGRAVGALGLSSDQEYQTLYPVPSREIVVAPGLTQNPGY